MEGPSIRTVGPDGESKESESAELAFLLVAFLWPRKEKSLATTRRAGPPPPPRNGNPARIGIQTIDPGAWSNAAEGGRSPFEG